MPSHQKNKIAKSRKGKTNQKKYRKFLGWCSITIATILIIFFLLIFIEPNWIRSIPYLGRAFAYVETIVKGPKIPAVSGLYGIDVSKHQGTIDWSRVELRYDMFSKRITTDGAVRVPLTFVIVKATEGITTTDPMFEYNKQGVLSRNMLFGAYHYFSYTTDAMQQAKKYLKVSQLCKGNIAPILDVEEDGNLLKMLRNKQIDASNVKQKVLQWLLYVEKNVGTRPIIYTSPTFKTKYLNSAVFDKYPFWIAHYQVTEPRLRGVMWQFTEHGSINGIDENVDINLFYGTQNEIEKILVK